MEPSQAAKPSAGGSKQPPQNLAIPSTSRNIPTMPGFSLADLPKRNAAIAKSLLNSLLGRRSSLDTSSDDDDDDDEEGKIHSDSDPEMHEPGDKELYSAVQNIVGFDHFDMSFNNAFYCTACQDKVGSQAGIRQLEHLIDLEHISNIGKECPDEPSNLTEKIGQIEKTFAALEKLKPGVVQYIKRKRMSGKMNKSIKTVRDDIRFLKEFQRDFWHFVCNLGSIPSGKSSKDREEIEVLQKICDPSYVAQCKNVEALDSKFTEFYARLSKFSSKVFKEEVQNMVSLLVDGMKEAAMKL